jgi:hypothetical protein
MDEADPRHGIEGVSAPTLYIREWYCNRRCYPGCCVPLLTFAICSEYTSVLLHHKQYLEQPELEPSQLKMPSLIYFILLRFPIDLSLTHPKISSLIVLAETSTFHKKTSCTNTAATTIRRGLLRDRALFSAP